MATRPPPPPAHWRVEMSPPFAEIVPVPLRVSTSRRMLPPAPDPLSSEPLVTVAPFALSAPLSVSVFALMRSTPPPAPHESQWMLLFQPPPAPPGVFGLTIEPYIVPAPSL